MFVSRMHAASNSMAVGFALSWIAIASATAEIPWTAPAAIVSAATGDTAVDTEPALASDGNGRWVAVWQAKTAGGDLDIFWAISSDNGASWSGPNTFYDPLANVGIDQHPRIATDRNGNWVVVWESTDPFGDSVGTDSDIASVRSTDNGDTWGAPQLLNPLAGTDGASDADTRPDVHATDDNFYVAWITNDPAVTGGVGTDTDIVFIRSDNEGANWSAPAVLDPNAALDTADAANPRIGSDGKDRVIIAWHDQEMVGPDLDVKIRYVASFNTGDNWTPVTPLLAAAEGNVTFELRPQIVFSRKTFFVFFESLFNWEGTGTDGDLFYVRSTDLAAGFGPIQPLLADAGTDIQSELNTTVATDNLGNIIVAYEDYAGSEPPDIRTVYSSDNGITFSAPQTVSTAPNNDAGPDSNPALANDGRGNWILLWDTTNLIAGADGTDEDIAQAQVFFRGSVSVQGRLYDRDSGMGIGCASLEFVWDVDKKVTRVVTTDQNGDYIVDGIPPGDYDVNLYPVGYPDDRKGVRVLAGQVTTFNVGFHVSDDGDIAITGVVTDMATGELLAGTKVVARRIDNKELVTYTCAEGRYQFFLDDIFDTKEVKGTQAIDLTYDADGYETGMNDASVPPTGGEVVNQALNKLAGPATLVGAITTAGTNSALSGAVITLSGLLNISTQSLNDGTYLFGALPAGNYSVRASKSGYTTEIASVPVPGETVASQNFALVDEGQTAVVPADLNSDGVVNAIDVQLAINGVLSIDQTVDADVNDDGRSDAIDIQLVINGALGA